MNYLFLFSFYTLKFQQQKNYQNFRLLLIFMFMLCSGGGWWYRFCRQPSVSSYTMTNTTTQQVAERQYQRRTTHGQNHRRQRLVQAMQHSRVLMNDPSMNVVWKSKWICIDKFTKFINQTFFFSLADMTNTPPPNYYSSANSYYHANNSQPALNYHPSVQQLQCPYYQLYGPPPSYDSVVQISNSCGSVQPTCVLVTSTVPCNFLSPTTANATLSLNDASSSNTSPSNSTNDATITSASAHPNDFEQPSTSSNIPNNAPSIEQRNETRRKSGTSSVWLEVVLLAPLFKSY